MIDDLQNPPIGIPVRKKHQEIYVCLVGKQQQLAVVFKYGSDSKYRYFNKVSKLRQRS